MELKLTSCFRSEVASRWTWRHRLWLQKQEVVKVFFVWLRMITSCDRGSGPHRVTLVVPSQVHPGGHVSKGRRHFSGRQWEHEGPEADHRPADGLLHTGHAGRWRLLQHHRSQFQSSVFSPPMFQTHECWCGGVCSVCVPQYNQEIHYVEPCLNGTLVRADRTNKDVSLSLLCLSAGLKRG